MSKRVIRTLVRVGVWLGTGFTVVRVVLGWYGELQTAKDVFENRGPIIDMLGRVVLSQWLWPFLAIGSFVAYLAMETWPKLKSAKNGTMPQAPTPAIAVPVEVATGTKTEPEAKRKLGVAELLVLEPKAVETFNQSVPATMAVLNRIGEHTKTATERLRVATKGFRPEAARARNLQAYLDYATAIEGELPALEQHVKRVEASAGDLASVYIGLTEYTSRKRLSLGPYIDRAKETVRLTNVNVPKIDRLIESVRDTAIGQAVALDDAADRYIALLERFKGSQVAMLRACEATLAATQGDSGASDPSQQRE